MDNNLFEQRWLLGKQQYSPKSSLIELQDFVKSTLWHDIENYLTYKLMLHRSLLEDPEVTNDTCQFIRGRCAEIRELLGLPDALIELIKNKQEGVS